MKLQNPLNQWSESSSPNFSSDLLGIVFQHRIMGYEVVGRFFLIFTSLFVIVDPIGIIPAFLGLTSGYNYKSTKKIVLKANIFAAITLILFSLFGNILFQFLQLELSAFRAAGGVLLFITALEMLRADHTDLKVADSELKSLEERNDISIVPLGIPLLSGPGAITSVMVFATDPRADRIYNFVAIFLAIFVVFAITYFVLLSSARIKKYLGSSGISVLQRIMGLLLAALSIQFIFEGSVQLFMKYFRA